MKCKNLNARYYRTNIFSMVLNILLFSIVFLVFSIIQKNWNLLWGILVSAVALIPFIVYYFIQFIYYQKLILEDVQEVKLENATNGKKFVGFYINMIIDRKKTKVLIKSIFTRNKGAYLSIDNFIHQKVKVAYNAKRNEAVVIGLVEE